MSCAAEQVSCRVASAGTISVFDELKLVGMKHRWTMEGVSGSVAVPLRACAVDEVSFR